MLALVTGDLCRCRLTTVVLLLLARLLGEHPLLLLVCGELRLGGLSLRLRVGLSLSLGLGLCLRVRCLLRRLSLCGLLGLHSSRGLVGAGSDAGRQSERGRRRRDTGGDGGRRDRARGEVRVGERLVRVVPPVGLKLEEVLEKGDRCNVSSERDDLRTLSWCLGNNGVQWLLGVLAERLLELDLGLVGQYVSWSVKHHPQSSS